MFQVEIFRAQFPNLTQRCYQSPPRLKPSEATRIRCKGINRSGAACSATSFNQTVRRETLWVQTTASPTINVNLGNSLLSQQAQPTPTVAKPKANLRFVETKSVQIHAGNGEFFESPQGLGDYRVTVACFRNEAIVGETLKQPDVKAHIIFRDLAGTEFGDVSSGVWLQVYKDAAPFTVGTKRCVILFLLTNQGTLKRLWKEAYVTEHSWMGGPSFRVRDEVIVARIA